MTSQGEASLLIVEDDERFANALALELTHRGYSVDCLDGLQAVEARTDLGYRYAVVDLKLGEDSGLDVIRLLKVRSPSTVIAILTGYYSSASAARAIELGAIACLSKPVAIERLESALLAG